jgi:uncharacterized membrane protein YeaQ/YmgE (transglycosylase-associated protein family)
MVWNVILWVVIGAIAGWLISFSINNTQGGDENQKIMAGSGVGIAGAVAAGTIFSMIDDTTSGFSWWSLLVALVGAFVVLFLTYYFIWRQSA